MSQQTSPPGSATSVDGNGELGCELEALRSHLRLINELDQQTNDLVARLADAVRSSADVRTQVGLEVEASLERVERLMTDRHLRQREIMAELREDITVAYERALGIAAVAQRVEHEMAGLHARMSEAYSEPAMEAEEPPADASPAQTSAPPASTSADPPTVPQPAASSVVIEVDQVPSASVALSIQRFVSGLPGVVAATTREYAAGHLRLEVMSRGAVRADEIGRWPGGRLEVVEQSADCVCFRAVA